ncbi:MAG TPA: hypothetical protein VFG30_23860 [Polyangiales bacterium]|nr:hypothetical protein [Polyangiales bacterium]
MIRALVVVVSWLCACAPSGGVYLGSDVHLDPAMRVDANAAPEDAASDGGVHHDAETPPVLEDAGHPNLPNMMQMATPMPAEPPSCAAGTADCDDDAGNGCEVDLMKDAKHCGACDVACSSADCVCQDGRFVTVCRAGRADCDANPANGCEVDSANSLQNCGSCGRLCHTNGHDAITAVCTNGQCHLTCQSELFPELDCDGNPDNGCETSIWTDNQNCGACGVRCNCLDGVCT